MSVGIEIATLDRWVYQRLAARVELTALIGGAIAPRIYSDAGPLDVPTPFVVFSVSSEGPDVRGLGGERWMVRPMYLVRAYSQQRSWGGVLKDVANQAEAALHLPRQTPGPIAGAGDVWGCLREQAFRQIEGEGDSQFRALGGFYRLYGAVQG